MRVGDLAAGEGEEEEEGRSEEFAEDGDEGVVEPVWDGAVEGGEALAERLGALVKGARVSEVSCYDGVAGTYMFGHRVRRAERKYWLWVLTVKLCVKLK